jgi:hypothetical protein
MTTMFARTELCDLFVHGVGGAMYDQLTDALIADFVQHPPPPYLTVTATMMLVQMPLAEHRRHLRQIARQLRDMEFNPQRHLDGSQAAELSELLEQKQRWIAQRDGDLARRHRGIQRCNALLRPHVAPQRAALIEERDQLRRRLPSESRLGSREHAFCLFDAQDLPRQLLDLAAIPS